MTILMAQVCFPLFLRTEYQSFHVINKDLPNNLPTSASRIYPLKTRHERFTITLTQNLITANETLFGRQGKYVVYSKLLKFH